MNIEARLKALERHTYGGRMSPAVSLIYPKESDWELSFALWDGVIGSGGKTIESTHNSEAAALAEYDRLLSRYHIKDGPVIILDV